jgi:hypothetical protein
VYVFWISPLITRTRGARCRLTVARQVPAIPVHALLVDGLTVCRDAHRCALVVALQERVVVGGDLIGLACPGHSHALAVVPIELLRVLAWVVPGRGGTCGEHDRKDGNEYPLHDGTTMIDAEILGGAKAGVARDAGIVRDSVARGPFELREVARNPTVGVEPIATEVVTLHCSALRG